MTDNIQKLYEIAGVPRIYSEFNNGKETVIENVFSPYRQLELIKWVIKLEGVRDVIPAEFGAYYSNKMWWLEFMDDGLYTVLCSAHKDFSQALAGLILQLWDELTDTQKEEIKEILECI